MKRYSVTKPLPTAEAEVAKFLWVEILLRHEAPRVVIIVCGTVFLFRLVSVLINDCVIWTSHIDSAPPSSKRNKKAVYVVSEVNSDMLSMCVDTEQKNWDLNRKMEILPYVRLLTMLLNRILQILHLSIYCMDERLRRRWTHYFSTFLMM